MGFDYRESFNLVFFVLSFFFKRIFIARMASSHLVKQAHTKHLAIYEPHIADTIATTVK